MSSNSLRISATRGESNRHPPGRPLSGPESQTGCRPTRGSRPQLSRARAAARSPPRRRRSRSPRPTSCTAEGASDSSSAPRKTVLTGWSISTIEVSTAGRRGSDTEIRSQPTTCEESASSTSHACDSRPGHPVDVADDDASDGGEDGRARVASNSGPAGPRVVGVPLPQDQDEQRVGDSREHAVDDAQRGVVAVGAAADHSGDEDHPDEDDRDRGERAVLRPLAERDPGEQSHEDDLGVAQHGREPGAHRLDRVVPEGEVGGEEDARRPGEPAVAPRARAVAAPLDPGEERPERAARRRSGRTPPSRATPRQGARGWPRRR